MQATQQPKRKNKSDVSCVASVALLALRWMETRLRPNSPGNSPGRCYMRPEGLGRQFSGVSIQRNARNAMNASNVRNVRNALYATHVRNASSSQFEPSCPLSIWTQVF